MFNKKKIMKRAVLLGLVGGLFLAMTSYAAPKYVETDIVENKIKAALFSVSLDPGDGTINNSKDPYRIVSNDTNSKVSFPTASKDYYDFKGFALLGNSKATYDIPASGQLTGSVQEYNLPIKDDKGNSLNGTTLKAIFQPHKYTITCNLDGGKINDSTNNYTATYDYESSLTLPTPSKDGYTFTEWTTTTSPTVTGSGSDLANGKVANNTAGNISLKANWEKNETLLTITSYSPYYSYYCTGDRSSSGSYPNNTSYSSGSNNTLTMNGRTDYRHHTDKDGIRDYWHEYTSSGVVCYLNKTASDFYVEFTIISGSSVNISSESQGKKTCYTGAKQHTHHVTGSSKYIGFSVGPSAGEVKVHIDKIYYTHS